ncbi:ABC transporter ATP-binding protein [Ornithinimicrobium tianjinense]|uniref:ABC transporter ATP-binding protein n=1 Tax=Ornithinimicrobium tianjinense TaxID=1195761 RepID=A0A917BVB7_9MICO|nr:ABC transporter ATP-binding protein [Ornithinimicrobium tianjinense]
MRALDGVSVGIEERRFTAIMGPSGSGKSTLMHLLAGLDTPTSGRVFLGDTELTSLSDRQLTTLRRQQVGFVFQAFNLLPTLTARQNVRLPLDLAGSRVDEAWERTVVEGLGLADRLGHRPGELSGGQQQRVALARALVTRPAVIFADEPTGALDSVTGAEVLALLRRSVDEWGQTVVMVTHDAGAAAVADRVLLLADGQVAGDLVDPDLDRVVGAVRGLGRA